MTTSPNQRRKTEKRPQEWTFTNGEEASFGDFKHQEDKKHRATYASLSDSESKFQFFSARQIACRLLGSRGVLVSEDCMCTKVTPHSLWNGMRLWVYMHPKDFLRQNNTGKLMWQMFGVESATLCLFGITEQEDMMWNEFSSAGKDNVWCLYPSKSTEPKSVDDYFSQDPLPLQMSSSEFVITRTNICRTCL